jgi:hypothetical protein
MKIRIAAIAILFGLSTAASAEIVTISRAYEVRLSDFTAPATLTGSVIFRPCFECESMSVRVAPETRYIVNRQSVELTVFRKQLSQVSDRAAETVLVKHHLESDTIVSISVTL